MLKQFKKGFTLAEVLIVIGIIGVVAALTLPNLNHATGDKETVTRVKKAYSTLNEAFDRAQAIYGPFNEWFNVMDILQNPSGVRTRIGDRLTEFMKVSKNCGNVANNDECIRIHQSSNPEYSFITSDGTSFSLVGDYTDHIYVDIDGPNKGSSYAGKDIFLFRIKSPNDGVVAGWTDEPRTDLGGNNCLTYQKSGAHANCAANWIIRFDNVDYLKADSTGKCNDSNIVLDWETNTSCH